MKKLCAVMKKNNRNNFGESDIRRFVKTTRLKQVQFNNKKRKTASEVISFAVF